MRVLVACEESQEVCKAFRALGHEAYSCDLQACSGGHPEWHIQGDAIKVLYSRKWDLVIAHPPCTYFSNSGVRWLFKGENKDPERWLQLLKSLRFWNEFVMYQTFTGVKMAIENPIPHKYARENLGGWALPGIGDYTQLIHPWQFGHGEQKSTCLWLKGVPKLVPTEIVEGREQRIWKMGPSEDRAKLRSKTFPGIARAMAEQWGGKIN